MRRALACIVLLLGLYPTEANYPRVIVMIQKALPGCAQARCVIEENDGGENEDFAPALEAILDGALSVPLVVDVPCTSWCALLADKLRKKPRLVCITPRATFLFHKEYDEKKSVTRWGVKAIEVNFRDPENPAHEPDIVQWVQEHGGFPKALENDDDYLKMHYGDAKKFWRTCTPAEIPP